MSLFDELIASAEDEVKAAQKRLDMLIQLRDEKESSEFVSTREAAEQLGISVQSVIIWLENGKLKGRKPGRKWQVSKASIRRCSAGS